MSEEEKKADIKRLAIHLHKTMGYSQVQTSEILKNIGFDVAKGTVGGWGTKTKIKDYPSEEEGKSLMKKYGIDPSSLPERKKTLPERETPPVDIPDLEGEEDETIEIGGELLKKSEVVTFYGTKGLIYLMKKELEEGIRRIPGIGPKTVDYIIERVNKHPEILERPQSLLASLEQRMGKNINKSILLDIIEDVTSVARRYDSLLADEGRVIEEYSIPQPSNVTFKTQKNRSSAFLYPTRANHISSSQFIPQYDEVMKYPSTMLYPQYLPAVGYETLEEKINRINERIEELEVGKKVKEEKKESDGRDKVIDELRTKIKEQDDRIAKILEEKKMREERDGLLRELDERFDKRIEKLEGTLESKIKTAMPDYMGFSAKDIKELIGESRKVSLEGRRQDFEEKRWTEEHQAKVALNDRLANFLNTFGEKVGTAIAGILTTTGEGTAVETPIRGMAGESIWAIPCPHCGEIAAIPKDSTEFECPKCSAKYGISGIVKKVNKGNTVNGNKHG